MLNFKSTSKKMDYNQLLLKHQDAFQAGNVYPDSYYDSICRKGKYHSVSEDTHWSEFLNVTINHIRRKYPPPWNEATEKLVVFLLGIVSHQVADISWHSLGIDQGFLSTMGDVNFHGSFSSAHSVGDPGGDVVGTFEWELDYIHTVSDWYVPVQDLVDIYREFYGKPMMDASIVEECTAIMFLARFGERLVFSKISATLPQISATLPQNLQLCCRIYNSAAEAAPLPQNLQLCRRYLQLCCRIYNSAADICNSAAESTTLPHNLQLCRIIYNSAAESTTLRQKLHLCRRIYNSAADICNSAAESTTLRICNRTSGCFKQSHTSRPIEDFYVAIKVRYVLSMSQLFPELSRTSPFLIEEFQSYFLGGVDDMAVWTANIWHHAIHMLDNGMRCVPY
ncbi:Glycosylphosphatidylinositol specific phospholipase D1 [Branchiostoma belcheri]|nr:Glycosylphosphatidylinositol specific phospholipase D1 [Branchiostoma belcheri]